MAEADPKRLNVELEQRVADRTINLNRSLKDLGAAQALLLQAGKLSALVEMAAGIAHEINNLLALIYI